MEIDQNSDVALKSSPGRGERSAEQFLATRGAKIALTTHGGDAVAAAMYGALNACWN